MAYDTRDVVSDNPKFVPGVGDTPDRPKKADISNPVTQRGAPDMFTYTTEEEAAMDTIVQLIGQIFRQMSPQLRNMLTEFLQELEEQARATSNPWDDLAVDVLQVVLGVEEE